MSVLRLDLSHVTVAALILLPPLYCDRVKLSNIARASRRVGFAGAEFVADRQQHHASNLAR
jgi:hypothetical protein